MTTRAKFQDDMEAFERAAHALRRYHRGNRGAAAVLSSLVLDYLNAMAETIHDELQEKPATRLDMGPLELRIEALKADYVRSREEFARETLRCSRLHAALEGALDSLEYVQSLHPPVIGYGVRDQRIAQGRAALEAQTKPEET